MFYLSSSVLGSIRKISSSPTDAKFATGSEDGAVSIWDFATATKESDFRDHGWDVNGVAWHPFYSLVASCSKDNTIKLFDPRATSTTKSTLFGHNNNVHEVCWSPSGNLLASGGRDYLVKIYDIRKMKEISTHRGHEKAVTTLAFHPLCDNLLLSGSLDGMLIYWMPAHMREPHTLLRRAHNYFAVSTIAWHPTGLMLASAGNDGFVKFWHRAPPGQPSFNPSGERGSIEMVG